MAKKNKVLLENNVIANFMRHAGLSEHSQEFLTEQKELEEDEELEEGCEMDEDKYEESEYPGRKKKKTPWDRARKKIDDLKEGDEELEEAINIKTGEKGLAAKGPNNKQDKEGTRKAKNPEGLAGKSGGGKDTSHHKRKSSKRPTVDGTDLSKMGGGPKKLKEEEELEEEEDLVESLMSLLREMPEEDMLDDEEDVEMGGEEDLGMDDMGGEDDDDLEMGDDEMEMEDDLGEEGGMDAAKVEAALESGLKAFAEAVSEELGIRIDVKQGGEEELGGEEDEMDFGGEEDEMDFGGEEELGR